MAGPFDTHPTPTTGGGHNHQTPDAAGSSASTNGYRLDPNPGWPLTFHILAPDDTRFSGLPLRLTVITLDATSRREPLYPTINPDGTWHTAFTPAPGTYQLLTDFTPANGPHTVLDSTISVTPNDP